MREWMTCQPAYVSDRRSLERKIVTALEAQGCRITTNAIGDHSAAGPVNITMLAQSLVLRRVFIEVTFNDALREDFETP